MRKTGYLLTLVFFAAWGCSGGEPPEAVESPQAPPPEPAPPEPPPAPVFDVHEWGLLNTTLGGEVTLQAGPSRTPDGVMGIGMMQGYGKPVLYFHSQGTDGFALEVGVELDESMVLAEHYPPGFLEGDRGLKWRTRIDPSPCPGPGSYPSDGDTICTAPDGYCEVVELAGYETSDAACISITESQAEPTDARWPLLFYRGSPRYAGSQAARYQALPLSPQRVSGTHDFTVTRRESEASPDTIGRIWRVRRSATGSWMRAISIAWPAPGEQATVPLPRTEDENAAARQMVCDDLASHGLTDSEVTEFEEAWMETLFGPGVAEDETAAGETGQGAGRGGGGLIAPTTRDVLLYWMPAADIDGLSELTFDPPARNVRRATLVRVDLSR